MRGNELHWAMAHMLTPLQILKYPCTPHPVPQEFLMFQKSFPLSFPYPVAKTAWLTSLVPFPQLSTLQTPPLQFLNPLMTWKATEIGPQSHNFSANSFSSPWVMLQLPNRTYPTAMCLLKLHCPSLAVYGQVKSLSIPPACLMYSKACDGRPPSHPWLSKSPAQSTSCCSEKVTFLPLPKMFQWASREPTVEKVQHEPHCPWFLTGVTKPVVAHSQAAGMAIDFFSIFKLLVAEHCCGAMSLLALNSSNVMSEKSLMP